MIFVTVGTQLPFDRLVRAVDAWASSNPTERVIAQIGVGAWRPPHLEWVEHLRATEHEVMMRAADLIVAHAGMGTLLRARSLGRPLIVMPREAHLGEHRNDHQRATARQLAAGRVVPVATTQAELCDLLDQRWHLEPPTAVTAAPGTMLQHNLRRLLLR